MHRALEFQGPALRDSLPFSKGTMVHSRTNANCDLFGKVIEKGIIDGLDPQNILVDVERVQDVLPLRVLEHLLYLHDNPFQDALPASISALVASPASGSTRSP